MQESVPSPEISHDEASAASASGAGGSAMEHQEVNGASGHLMPTDVSAGRVLQRSERGLVSAEWAVAIIAAIAIASVLVNFITHGVFGDVFTGIVLNIIKTIATVGQ